MAGLEPRHANTFTRHPNIKRKAGHGTSRSRKQCVCLNGAGLKAKILKAVGANRPAVFTWTLAKTSTLSTGCWG